MANVGLLEMPLSKKIINGQFKGSMYLLFATTNCNSCVATMEALAAVIQDIDFDSDKLYIVEKEYFAWIGLVKKFKPKSYPCLVKTFDSNLVESYYSDNIIKILGTGLKDAV